MTLQLTQLHKAIDNLQAKHGHKDYCALYGTGCIKNPRVMFLFMNPTARNVTVHKEWKGIRAPWIGIKTTWTLMHRLGFITDELYKMVQSLKSGDWDHSHATALYNHIAGQRAYLTNLARCTQPDARHVHDQVFRESREVTLEEIRLLNPEIIFAFGNQVASHLLGQTIKVSECRGKKFDLKIGKKIYAVYPTYYPVGMGLRNMGKAVEDMKKVLNKEKKR